MNTYHNLGSTLAGLQALPLFAASGSRLGGLSLLLILVACPLMMFFMMRGMSHGHDQTDHDQADHNHEDHAGSDPLTKGSDHKA